MENNNTLNEALQTVASANNTGYEELLVSQLTAVLANAKELSLPSAHLPALQNIIDVIASGNASHKVLTQAETVIRKVRNSL